MAVNDSIAKPEIVAPCDEEEPPTGVVTPVNDCQTNFAATYPQGTPERDFLNHHPEMEVALDGMLFRATDCEEATEFANNIIKSSLETGLYINAEISAKSPMNVDLSNISLDTLEGARFVCIYNKLLESPAFKNLFVNTFGSFQNRRNAVFKVEDNLFGNGQCKLGNGPLINNEQTFINEIKISKSFLGENITSNINVTKTILHECIHAFLNSKKINCGNGATIENLNNKTLEELITLFYSDFNCHITVNGTEQSQHAFMFDYLILTFSSILSEISSSVLSQSDELLLLNETYFDLETNTIKLFVWNDIFKYASMPGLTQTDTFQFNIVGNPIEYNKYTFYSSRALMCSKTCN
ncbi:hypothetical protein [Flavobacterium sp.]|uniref:hypothetical protein n=1 Tax=Flavobacterium sp. TaxID=239 RepID=UPI002626FE4C|nr:hypothetical protein [Flavobacterium sp.]